jgi:hypothetical protein
LKGLYGHGFYVSLITDDGGRGLGLANPTAAEVQWVRDLKGIDIGGQLIPSNALTLTSEENSTRVLAKIARALLDLGWGPWIGQHHQVIAERSEQIDPQALQRLRWDRLLKFSPGKIGVPNCPPGP